MVNVTGKHGGLLVVKLECTLVANMVDVPTVIYGFLSHGATHIGTYKVSADPANHPTKQCTRRTRDASSGASGSSLRLGGPTVGHH